MNKKLQNSEFNTNFSTLTSAQIIAIHDVVVSIYDELNGFKRNVSIKFVEQLAHEISDPNISVITHATNILYSLMHNHPFIAGNKRTALLVVTIFLNKNNLDFLITPEKGINLLLQIEAGKMSQDEIYQFISEHVVAQQILI